MADLPEVGVSPGPPKRKRVKVDPITLRVLGGAFDAIAQEMAGVLFRMSYSSIIRESEDLGAGIFEWAVLVDPAQLGPAADLEAARALVQRWNPAHCRGYFCQYATAAAGGGSAAIFDDPNAIFEECLYGS